MASSSLQYLSLDGLVSETAGTARVAHRLVVERQEFLLAALRAFAVRTDGLAVTRCTQVFAVDAHHTATFTAFTLPLVLLVPDTLVTGFALPSGLVYQALLPALRACALPVSPPPCQIAAVAHALCVQVTQGAALLAFAPHWLCVTHGIRFTFTFNSAPAWMRLCCRLPGRVAARRSILSMMLASSPCCFQS